MILYEYEGKEILQKAGIAIPNGQTLHSLEDRVNFPFPLIIKAQVLSGKRADNGGIIKVSSEMELVENLEELSGKIVNKETVEKVLVEEVVEIEQEYYLSLSYDTDTRGSILSFSQSGGTGIEERGVRIFPIDPLNIPSSLELVEGDIPKDLLTKITQVFFDSDALLLEINPLVKVASDKSQESRGRKWVALDAKIKLDDYAKARHEDWNFPPRGVPGYSPTANEMAAKRIDEEDYRGTAGSAYFDLPGDIAILSSCGGVSLTALDALIKAGGKPANFTEYSGNPPKEKVAKLTKVVLNKPNIHGLWVIGTVVANFTDIFETLSGLMDGLRQAQTELGTKFDFPIVIRRGGPRVDEAYTMLKEVKDFDLTLLGPETSVSQAAEIMAQKAKEYEQKHG